MLRRIATDLGRDADEFARVLDGLPDGAGAAARSSAPCARSSTGRARSSPCSTACYLAEAMPTLLVWGERDGVIPVAHAHLAHASMPGSRLELFEDAGHFPHHHDPDRFVAVLRDFLATTEPAPYEPDAWRALLANGPAEQPEPASAVEDLAFADRTSGS